MLKLSLQQLTPIAKDYLEFLEFAYQADIGEDDALIYMLRRTFFQDRMVGSEFFKHYSACLTAEQDGLPDKQVTLYVIPSWKNLREPSLMFNPDTT